MFFNVKLQQINLMLYINNVYCEKDSMIFAHGDQNLYMYIVFTGNIRFALCLVSDPLLVLSQLLRQIQSPITKTCSTTINTASPTNEIFSYLPGIYWLSGQKQVYCPHWQFTYTWVRLFTCLSEHRMKFECWSNKLHLFFFFSIKSVCAKIDLRPRISN